MVIPRIVQLASNFCKVSLPNGEVYVSYETPVAATVLGEGCFRRKQFFSVTTSRQLNRFCAKNIFKEVDEDRWSLVISDLLGEETSKESSDENFRRFIDIR